MRVHDWTKVSAGDFHDFHTVWAGEIRTRLNQGILPEGFYAQVEQVAQSIIADVLTLHSEADSSQSSDAVEVSGGLALATAPPRVREVVDLKDEIYLARQKQVVIRHASTRRVVALIEFVSSGNKASRLEWQRFLDKAVAAIRQGIHLVIVDLYPPGRRDPLGVHAAIWQELGGPPYSLPPDKHLTQVAYLSAEMKRAFIEPLAVGDELSSVMPLFLNDERYVPVPLPEAYASAFDGAPRPIRDLLEASLPAA